MRVSAAGSKRAKVLYALTFGAVVGTSVAVTVYRGTRVAVAPLSPTSVDEGTHCQLRDLDGRKPVECALVVPEPVDDVWRRITGYRAGTLFDVWWGRYDLREVKNEGAGRTRLTGSIAMWLRTLPVDITVEERVSGAERTASWSSAGSAFVVNRGGWTLVTLDPKRTLVRYTLDIELAGAPSFVLRALLLDHLAPVVETVANSASGD